MIRLQLIRNTERKLNWAKRADTTGSSFPKTSGKPNALTEKTQINNLIPRPRTYFPSCVDNGHFALPSLLPEDSFLL